jgi:hypothetical protein
MIGRLKAQTVALILTFLLAGDVSAGLIPISRDHFILVQGRAENPVVTEKYDHSERVVDDIFDGTFDFGLYANTLADRVTIVADPFGSIGGAQSLASQLAGFVETPFGLGTAALGSAFANAGAVPGFSDAVAEGLSDFRLEFAVSVEQQFLLQGSLKRMNEANLFMSLTNKLTGEELAKEFNTTADGKSANAENFTHLLVLKPDVYIFRVGGDARSMGEGMQHVANFSAALTPIPEPTSVVLLATGGLAVVVLRRRASSCKTDPYHRDGTTRV